MQLWEKAMHLEEFILHCQPKGYREQIHVFSNVPYVTEDDYLVFEKGYKENRLEEVIKNHNRLWLGGGVYFPFDKPYFIEAIKEYFEIRGREVNKGERYG